MKFTKKEMDILSDPGIFLTKDHAARKIKDICSELRMAIQKEMLTWNFIAPKDFNQDRFKISKGENLNGFPYVYLDCPQYFTRSSFLTFRVIFWWGKYIVSALLLQGENLPTYKQNLMRIKNQLPSYYLSCVDSPWQWGRGKKHEIPLSGNKKAAEIVIQASRFIKISWYLSYKAFFQSRFDFIQYQIRKYHQLTPIFTQSN